MREGGHTFREADVTQAELQSHQYTPAKYCQAFAICAKHDEQPALRHSSSTLTSRCVVSPGSPHVPRGYCFHAISFAPIPSKQLHDNPPLSLPRAFLC